MNEKYLPILGQHLRAARKRRFAYDNLNAFAARLGVARSTLQKMEKGDLTVTLERYYNAAKLLGVADQFNQLFYLEPPLFDD